MEPNDPTVIVMSLVLVAASVAGLFKLAVHCACSGLERNHPASEGR